MGGAEKAGAIGVRRSQPAPPAATTADTDAAPTGPATGPGTRRPAGGPADHPPRRPRTAGAGGTGGLDDGDPRRLENSTGSGHTLDELNPLIADKKALPTFALPGTLRAHATLKHDPLDSANVVGSYEGSDPELKTNSSSCPRTSITSASAAR